MGKKKDEKKDKKKGKKKIILIGLLVAVIAAAAAYFLVIRGKGGGKPKLPDPVEAYTLQEESVASITAAFEEKGKEVLLSVSTSSEPEDEEDKKDKEDSEKEEDSDRTMQEDEKAEGDWSYYYYRIGPDSEDTIEKYKEFLLEEGFELVTNDKDFKQPVSQYAEAYQRDGAQKGRLFVIELEYPMAGDSATGIYSIKVRLEEKLQIQPVTRDETLKYFKGLDPKLLGLEKPIEEYSIMMDMGRTFVDGKECYGISLYEKGEEEESYFVKKFYLSLAEKKLYEYLGGDIIGMQQNSSVSGSAESSASSSDGSGGVHDWNIGPTE